jgi:hypothetical protein
MSACLTIHVLIDGEPAWTEELQLFRYRGIVRFRASDGCVYEVSVDQLDAALKIDPGIQIIRIM